MRSLSFSMRFVFWNLFADVYLSKNFYCLIRLEPGLPLYIRNKKKTDNYTIVLDKCANSIFCCFFFLKNNNNNYWFFCSEIKSLSAFALAWQTIFFPLKRTRLLRYYTFQIVNFHQLPPTDF